MTTLTDGVEAGVSWAAGVTNGVSKEVERLNAADGRP
jgi:hypothetical protein